MRNLQEFLSEHKVSCSTTHKKHSRAGWIQIETCPWCHSGNFHLGITLDCSRASCYVCGGKHVPQVLKALTDASWADINAVVGSRIYVQREDTQPQCGTYKPPYGLRPLMPSHRNYLTKRGFDPDTLADVWGLQSCGPFSDYADRIFIPILKPKEANRPATEVSWTTRGVWDDPTRYMNAPKDRKSCDEKQLLFGAQYASKNAVIIVEGPFDVFRVGPGAVGILGLAYTPAQLEKLTDYWKRVIVLDRETKAQSVAHRLATELSGFPGETYVVEIDADDPGEMPEAERRKLRDFAFKGVV